MDPMLLDQFARLLDDAADAAAVRDVESGGSAQAMWSAFAGSGFLDALVPEERGGAGLLLGDTGPLIALLGAHAVPVPVGETMVARALLAEAGQTAPDGPILLADLSRGGSGVLPAATHAKHVLAETGESLRLYALSDLPVADLALPNSAAATIEGAGEARPLAECRRQGAGLRALGAIVRAAQISGAARRVLEMTVAYAGDRIQFGKPIGKQQAVQQNLALMAELVAFAEMAAQAGCAEGLEPRIEVAAVAKQSASRAAAHIANSAHAVHGAIGISSEYDLQLFTRRLHEWRMADGSERYWARILGERRLAAPEASSVDYVRAIEHR